mmetsp:Transcript_16532/g.28092  ORF Transcript_16532/g.28092 Transcript_16532/m.28092 type:complete len:91 (+) Transcript_16532:1497-1769(+)
MGRSDQAVRESLMNKLLNNFKSEGTPSPLDAPRQQPGTSAGQEFQRNVFQNPQFNAKAFTRPGDSFNLEAATPPQPCMSRQNTFGQNFKN